MQISHLNTSGVDAEMNVRSKITADELIALYYEQRPKLVWRIGREVFDHVSKLCDSDRGYLMNEGRRTLMSQSFEIVEGNELQLITKGGNRE